MCEKRAGKGVWREGEEVSKEGRREGERKEGRKEGERKEETEEGERGRGKERGRREESKGVVSKEGEMREWERSGPCATGIQ